MKIFILFLSTSLAFPVDQLRERRNDVVYTDDSVFDKILAVNQKAFKQPLSNIQSKIYEGDIVLTKEIQKYVVGRPKRKISYREHVKLGTGDLYQGDIMATNDIRVPTSYRDKRGSQNNPTKFWPLVNGFREIPYVIDDSVSYMDRIILKAIKEWEEEISCLKFVPRTNQRDYIIFHSGNGCSSPLGRVGGRQYISLDEECGDHAIILHEIGHSLGFWHEQSRPDRDEYITIIWENIIPDLRYNFDKQFTVNSFAVPYDYDSIMHYGPYAFSVSPGYAVTIETKDGQAIGHRQHLSRSDVLQARLMYNCSAF